MPLSPGSSFTIQIQLTNPSANPIFVNSGAVVEATITDSSGVNVDGTWPVTLSYITSSDGLYSASLDPITGLIIGNTYITTINAVVDGTLEIKSEQKQRATKRVSCA